MSEITMYAASKLVNGWLKEAGVQKTLPPQMFYGYAKKGYIQSFENEKGKVCTTEDALKTWFEKYRTPKTKKVTGTVEYDNDGTVGEWV